MDQKYITQVQIKEIQRYLRIMSKRKGKNLGETGCLEWIEKNAKKFREFVENTPSYCINCGFCGKKEQNECEYPLNRKRLRKIRVQQLKNIEKF